MVRYRVFTDTKVACLLDYDIYKSIKLIAALNGTRPLDPVGPPQLIPDRSTGRAGQFIVDLSDAAPQQREGESVHHSAISNVTFLFRFQEMDTSHVSFNWTVSKIHCMHITTLDYITHPC